jgi:hypothetical protein
VPRRQEAMQHKPLVVVGPERVKKGGMRPTQPLA